jgi:TM2 domain-containing membrane protein YozV
MSNQNNKFHHPGIAAVLSFVFNGLGQLYNGQIAKGLTIIFFSAVSMLILILGSILIGLWLLGKIASGKLLYFGFMLFSLGLISVCGLGIYSIIDSYRAAVKR